jgi:hypothetical protein
VECVPVFKYAKRSIRRHTRKDARRAHPGLPRLVRVLALAVITVVFWFWGLRAFERRAFS